MTRFRPLVLLPLLGGICAIGAFGCGAGGTHTAGSTEPDAKKAAPVPAKNGPTPAGCHLGHLLHALERLEGNLAVGLSYEQYFEEVSAARVAYEAVPVQSLELPCLNAFGTPAEKALDKYIEGANVWRACRADARCGTYAIEPRLQRGWRVASHYLDEIR